MTTRLSAAAPIVAIVYDESGQTESVMQRVARHLVGKGVRVAGFVQVDVPCDDKPRCDMVLEDVAGGERYRISEDRGPMARGCRLDLDSLLHAEAAARRALDGAPDLLILNKFGKAEAEGGGFRPLIAEAMARDIPVLIAVARRNLAAWAAFVTGLSIDHPVGALAGSDDDICRALGLLPRALAAE